tara:strand:+ start:236 stop:1510 length:1275 start_codon:yes stop_codon:yes gene_type:complete
MAFDCIKVNFPYFENKNKWHNYNMPFIKNYFEIIKTKIQDIKTSHFWVLASFMDFDNSLFDYIPEKFQQDQIHVFYSGQNKEGNIMLVPKQKFLEQIDNLKTLRDFKDINYHKAEVINPTIPTVNFQLNNLTEDYNKGNTKPYTWMVNKNLKDWPLIPNYFPSFWEEQKMYSWGDTNDIMLVPYKEKIDQLYDFEFITNIKSSYPVEDMDIIFISYDEPSAEERFKSLKEKYPRAKWCKNIEGQTSAYHTAANMCETDYFFAVFPKLEVVENFKFNFQPDRFKNPCHYIFNCKNPVNGLEYGHGSILLYNKKLTLETKEPGIDFTLSAPHEVVPVLSAINHFNETPWLAWRTAFREIVKLLTQQTPTVESKYRLKKWCDLGTGKNAEWVYCAANDAKEFVESNDDIMKTYNFKWLKNFYEQKYG